MRLSSLTARRGYAFLIVPYTYNVSMADSFHRPSRDPSVIPANHLQHLSPPTRIRLPIFASTLPSIAKIAIKISMPSTVSKTSANAIACARHHLRGITGYTIRSDTLIRHTIEYGRGYDQTQRLALVGDMALRAAIIGNWYRTGSNVSVCISIRWFSFMRA